MFTSILSLYKARIMPTFDKNANVFIFQSIRKNMNVFKKSKLQSYMVSTRYVASLIRFNEI